MVCIGFEIAQQFLHFLFDLRTGRCRHTYIRSWRVAQAGRNAQKPGISFVQRFSRRAIIFQGAIDLSDQAAKESVFGHWQAMQGLGYAFQLVVTLQPTPVEGFAGGPIYGIPDRQTKLAFNLQQLLHTLGFRSADGVQKKELSAGKSLVLGKPPKSARICWRNSVSFSSTSSARLPKKCS